jgi:5-methylcytosine-specific restriction endonuclease McrA
MLRRCSEARRGPCPAGTENVLANERSRGQSRAAMLSPVRTRKETPYTGAPRRVRCNPNRPSVARIGASHVFKIDTARRNFAAQRQNYLCCYCGFPMWEADSQAFAERYRLPPGDLPRLRCTAEHVIPRSTGGSDSGTNIVAACAHCNHTRHKRKNPPAPELYRADVVNRIRRGRWHSPEAHRAFRMLQQRAYRDCR